MKQPRQIFTRSNAGFFNFDDGRDINRARWFFSIVGTLLILSLSYLLYLRSVELHKTPELWLSKDSASDISASQNPVLPHPKSR